MKVSYRQRFACPQKGQGPQRQFGMLALYRVERRQMLDAKHWRARAEEARVHAEQMTNPVAREAMLEIAKQYELLAQWAEAREPGKGSLR